VFHPARLAGVCAACLLASASSASGQTVGDATGAIEGVVIDAAGGVLPNVLVRVSGPAMMGAREDLSRDDGFYRVPALVPGDYEVSFTRGGFRSAIRRDVRVRPGATVTIPVTLEIEARREVVTVESGSPLGDRRGTSLGVAMNARELADLPGSRTAAAVLAAAPAILMAGSDVGGHTALAPRPFSAYGTAGYNNPTLEGISISQHQRFGFSPDYGSFAEVWTGLGAYGPEWPSPGVHVQVLTKSGGNQYRGSSYAAYQDAGWQAHNIDADQIARGAAASAAVPARNANRLDRYQDVSVDVGGYLVPNRWWWYASARNQRVAARLVAFPARPVETEATTASVKTTFRIRNGTLVLFAHPGTTRQPIQLGSFLRPGGAVHTSQDSTAEQTARGVVWKADWSAAYRGRLFAEARAGQFVTWRAEAPHGMAPRVEDLVAPTVQGGNRTWREDLQRSQLNGSISHLSDGPAGRHHLKSGGDVQRSIAAETWYSSYPGDVLHVTRSGVPAEVYLFEAPSQSINGLWWYSAFASDSWQPHSRLTVNAGLRYDRFRIFLPRQSHPAGRFNKTPQSFAAVDRIAAWHVVAPRTGVNVDLRGDGRALLKASFGIYRLPPASDLGFNLNPNARVWWERYTWIDAQPDRLWQPGEEASTLERRGGTSSAVLDPGLVLPYVREITARIEQDLGGRLGIATGVVWRAERQQGSGQLSNRDFDMFTVSTLLRDPGPAGTTLDSLAGGGEIRVYDLPEPPTDAPELVIRNAEYSNNDYVTWEAAADRRVNRRWSLAASFAHTWNREHASGYAGQAVRVNEYPATPNDLINTDGDGRHVFRVWSGKASATILGPWGLQVTPLLRHQSGQPFGRTVLARLNYGTIRVLAEPVGTRRQDTITLLDLGVQKHVPAGGGRRVSVFVQVFNLLNGNAEQNVSWASGPTFLRPLTILPPRIARAGLRMDW
jgi:hypothetical protein